MPLITLAPSRTCLWQLWILLAKLFGLAQGQYRRRQCRIRLHCAWSKRCTPKKSSANQNGLSQVTDDLSSIRLRQYWIIIYLYFLSFIWLFILFIFYSQTYTTSTWKVDKCTQDSKERCFHNKWSSNVTSWTKTSGTAEDSKERCFHNKWSSNVTPAIKSLFNKTHSQVCNWIIYIFAGTSRAVAVSVDSLHAVFVVRIHSRFFD